MGRFLGRIDMLRNLSAAKSVQQAISFPLDIRQDSSQRRIIIQQVRENLSDLGFFYLNPEPFISAKLLLNTYSHATSFFKLPDDIKSKYKTDLNKNSRGWTPLYAEPSYQPGQISRVESFDLALDVAADDPHATLPGLGPNVWPDEELKNFRPDISSLYNSSTVLADIIFELLAESVDLEANTFLQHATRKRHSHMRLLHYPGISENIQKIPFMITATMRMSLRQLGYSDNDIKSMTPVDAHKLLQPNDPVSLRSSKEDSSSYTNDTNLDVVGISAHTDFECFTFIHQSAPGLQAQLPNGNWMDVNPPTVQTDIGPVPCFTVLIGDMIERFTNGLIRATPHRVPVTPHHRISIVRFNGFDGDVVVAPLDKFIDKTLSPPSSNNSSSGGGDSKYPPVTQGEHIRRMMDDGLKNREKLKDNGSLPDEDGCIM